MGFLYFFSVQQSHCVILERFGKYSRTCNGGISFRIPILENVKRIPEWGNVAIKEGRFIELSEQHTDTPKRSVHTKDNVEITADASVYWRIIDPVKSCYEVDILPQAVEDSALNALRACIGELDLDSVLSQRQKLNDKISSQLSDSFTKWGVKLNRVEIQSLEVSGETSKAMLQQMEAERARRAAVSAAEGEAETTLKMAEASRKASILKADGESRAIEMIAKAEQLYLQALVSEIGKEAAAQLLLSQKMIKGYEEISKGKAHKVFLPSSVKEMIVGDLNTN